MQQSKNIHFFFHIAQLCIKLVPLLIFLSKITNNIIGKTIFARKHLALAAMFCWLFSNIFRNILKEWNPEYLFFFFVVVVVVVFFPPESGRGYRVHEEEKFHFCF